MPPAEIAPRGDAAAIAAELREACGPSIVAVIAFGSRVTGADPDANSAWDLFTVVERYGPFYAQCARHFGWRRPPWLLSAWNRVLPPNVVHLQRGQGPGAKLFVITEKDLHRRLRPARVDRFSSVRLMQDVRIADARDAAAHQRLERALHANRLAQVAGMRAFLPGTFDVTEFCKRLLSVSYRSEVRPETGDRAEQVFAAQRAGLEGLYRTVLREAVRDGVLVTDGAGCRYARPATRIERWRAATRLHGSRAIATLRWIQHVITFEGWLDYIVAKVERRTELRVEVTDRERGFPLLLLPKLFRVLRSRGESSPSGVRR